MARSVIGKPGRNPGPGKTSIAGTGSGKNLGRTTSMKRGASMNRDVTVAFKRRGINPGPGGNQRPPSGLTGS